MHTDAGVTAQPEGKMGIVATLQIEDIWIHKDPVIPICRGKKEQDLIARSEPAVANKSFDGGNTRPHLYRRAKSQQLFDRHVDGSIVLPKGGLYLLGLRQERDDRATH